MNTITRVLAIVDPAAHDHPALRKAGQIASWFNASVDMFACETRAARDARLARRKRSRRSSSAEHIEQVDDLEERLDAVAHPVRETGVDVAVETECTDRLQMALLDRAKHTSAELIVIETHHHSLAKRTVLMDPDWALIRGSPVPLLLAKPGKWPDPPVFAAAVDPGHADDKPATLDHRILQVASFLAHRVEGELHVVHTYMPVAIIAGATGASPPMVGGVSPEVLTAEDQAKRKLLQNLTQPYDIPPRRIHLDVGTPSEFLPRIAEEVHANIMVMGAIARSGLKRIFVGNTAERVLDHLPCDALIVKPPDFDIDMSF